MSSCFVQTCRQIITGKFIFALPFEVAFEFEFEFESEQKIQKQRLHPVLKEEFNFIIDTTLVCSTFL